MSEKSVHFSSQTPEPTGSSAVLDELLDYWEDVRGRSRTPMSIFLQREDQGGTLTGIVVRLNALLKLRTRQQNTTLAAPAVPTPAGHRISADGAVAAVVNSRELTYEQLAEKCQRLEVPVCIGWPTINLLRKNGQHLFDSGHGLIAADDLFCCPDYKAVNGQLLEQIRCLVQWCEGCAMRLPASQPATPN